MLIPRTGKMRVREAKLLAVQSQCIANFDDPDLLKVRGDLMSDFHRYCNMTNKIVGILGEPLVRVREYESSPGLWVLDDGDTGIVFLVWSDCYKKNAWKGTAIEAIVTDENTAQIADAYRRLSVLLEY
jgi:hypothetical protein